jgi:hypothetical protein
MRPGGLPLGDAGLDPLHPEIAGMGAQVVHQVVAGGLRILAVGGADRVEEDRQGHVAYQPQQGQPQRGEDQDIDLGGDGLLGLRQGPGLWRIHD